MFQGVSRSRDHIFQHLEAQIDPALIHSDTLTHRPETRANRVEPYTTQRHLIRLNIVQPTLTQAPGFGLDYFELSGSMRTYTVWETCPLCMKSQGLINL